LECAAIQDVLAASGELDAESSLVMKRKLRRIVALLTRMAMKLDGVAEATTDYRADSDYEHEYRFAGHEHEHETGAKTETPGEREPESVSQLASLGNASARPSYS